MWRLIARCPGDETLVALLDDELDLPERVSAERHLDRCGRCAGIARLQQRADSALRAAFGAEPFDLAPVPAAASRRLRGVFVAGAGVLLGSAGAITIAGLMVRRFYHRAHA